MRIDPNDRLIEKMFETVRTPHYDVSQAVLRQLRSVPQKKAVWDKTFLAAAAFSLFLVFMVSAVFNWAHIPAPPDSPPYHTVLSSPGAQEAGDGLLPAYDGTPDKPQKQADAGQARNAVYGSIGRNYLWLMPY